MTLEDFFTLTEMKDGLTAPSRVEELVAVMQQEKDYVLKNISEATRQWCTVATTLAATENRDCLNLFLQLDGLYFINKWLKEAQNHGNESNDTIVEESITALLRALEKLGVDDQGSVSSGIFVTVKDLLGHSSTKVNERARSLFDAWRKESNSVELVCDPVPKRSGSEEISVVENDFQDKRVGVQIETSNDATNSRLTSDSVEGENLCAKEETPLGKICSLDLKEANVEHRSGYSNSNEISDEAKQNQKLESSPVVLVREISSTSDALKSRGFTEMGNESMTESALQNVAVFNYCSAEGYAGNSEHLSDKYEGTGPTLSRTENASPDVEEAQEHASEESEENSENASVFLKQEMGHKDTDEMDELEYGIVDALEVARQVAKEVEREVGERNERSSRSSSSSSSKKSLENKRQSQPRSPESINGRKRSPNRETALPNKALDGQDFSTEVSPNGKAEQLITTSDERKLKLENSTRDVESSSQVTEAAQEQEVETAKKEMYGFDLNEEVCSEEMERPGNFVSVPIPVVSRTVATANNLPGNPRQFEGTHGWKGSAATSAFRPASPRRTSDGDKAQALSVGGIHSCSKQRVDLLDFDLNIVDSAADDKIPDFISGKQILTSGESSVETPRKSETLKLDLNRVSDESDPPPSDWKTLFHHNGHCSPSPASSSSSMQPSVRNFDLNDRPAFVKESNYQHHQYISKSSSQNHKLNEPVISILGARVAVNRKDFISQTPSPFLNGIRAHEPAMGGLFGMGPTASYTTHPPVFGYNGMTTMSFPSNVYGPGPAGLGPCHGGLIPCMVDSRGAPVVPQIVGSAPSLPPSPFIMSMSGPSPGLNGPRPMQPSFDLNSGFMIDGGSRDLGSLRQPFVAGPTQLMEEHFRANSNPNSQASSSSGIGGKRKEPDSGWESYQFHYKQHPPWK